MTLPPTRSTRTTRTITIYLIRHGEAAHNVEEKKAEKRVLAEAAAEGLGPDHPETRERILLARQAILTDESFFDAALTSRGEEEAKQAHARIAAWTSKAAADNDPPLVLLPAPQEVFVSPLRRALRTADLIFPPQAQQQQQSTTPIHVYEDLRERLTGRPADNRFASHILANCFKRFDFHHLRINSFHHLIALAPNNNSNNNNNSTPKVESGEPMRRASFHPFNDSDEDDEEEEQWLEGILNSERGRPRTKGHVRSATAAPETSPSLTNTDRMQRKLSSCNTDTALEDNEKLQERAIKLFDMLAKYQSDSVAIVTHKGFLRELEHGCFGLTDTKEFQNCEVRVYRATFQMRQMEAETTMLLEKIERLK